MATIAVGAAAWYFAATRARASLEELSVQRGKCHNPATPVPRRRVYFTQQPLRAGTAVLSGAEAHYVSHVLRLAANHTVLLFDGHGTEAAARLVEVHRHHVELLIEPPITTAPDASVRLTLAVSLPKAERSDWLVEKATELGAASIMWIAGARSNLPRQSPSDGRMQRWQRLAAAALAQSGRTELPELVGPMHLCDFLQINFPHRFVASPAGQPLPSWNTFSSAPTAALLVGPEGGFTSEETRDITAAGYLPVRLSPHVLRVETAAIAGLALLLHAAMRPTPSPP